MGAALRTPFHTAIKNVLFRDLPDSPRDVPTKPGEHQEDVRKSIQAEFGIDCVHNYNFGVSGSTGAVKSTFINALMGLKVNSDSAAKVGIGESTTKIRAYRDPRSPHIVYWDTPGCGTKSFPAAEYFEEQKLFAFDCIIIIITGGSILEADIDIARAAQHHGLPLYFVRLMSDMSLRKVMEEEDCPLEEAVSQLRKVVKVQEQHLTKAGIDKCRIFNVSARVMLEMSTGQPTEYQMMDETAFIQEVFSAAFARRNRVQYNNLVASFSEDLPIQVTVWACGLLYGSIKRLFFEPPNNPRDVPTKPGEHPDDVRKLIQDEFGIDCVHKYNFGVSGHSGHGKSSFINALIGLKANSVSAAKVGAVECTTKIHPYYHPRYPHIVYWDTPGCGTPSFPAAEYFEKQKLFAFDCIIIITGRSILESDIDIARAAQHHGLPMYFVRSMSDKSLSDVMNDMDCTLEQAVLELRKVVKDQEQRFTEKGINNCRIFNVSARVMLEISTGQPTTKYQTMDEIEFIKEVVSAAFDRRNPGNAIAL
ncbi:putative Interferon-inducible GTPase 1 [Hypsibius exemplaris]|uniref:Interferon-inducible GTPase 1 n=1 Tax=Hypsibius exemplaris TaxID=2072580 RepID=A0A1W0WH16_HYPEX|nr:putative Interferon-inducible GTPase 1 [Hypsibius exemplaris]